jgi:hypothetical protein
LTGNNRCLQSIVSSATTESLRLFERGHPSLNLRAVPQSAILIRQQNRLAVVSPARRTFFARLEELASDLPSNWNQGLTITVLHFLHTYQLRVSERTHPHFVVSGDSRRKSQCVTRRLSCVRRNGPVHRLQKHNDGQFSLAGCCSGARPGDRSGRTHESQDQQREQRLPRWPDRRPAQLFSGASGACCQRQTVASDVLRRIQWHHPRPDESMTGERGATTWPAPVTEMPPAQCLWGWTRSALTRCAHQETRELRLNGFKSWVGCCFMPRTFVRPYHDADVEIPGLQPARPMTSCGHVSCSPSNIPAIDRAGWGRRAPLHPADWIDMPTWDPRVPLRHS